MEFRIYLDKAWATQNTLTTAAAAMAVPQENNNNNNNMSLHLKIPDPKKYKGDRDKLRPFLTQLRLKAALYLDN